MNCKTTTLEWVCFETQGMIQSIFKIKEYLLLILMNLWRKPTMVVLL